MTGDDDDMWAKTGYLSRTDIQKWAEAETERVNKASELRIKEATEIATHYSAGKITPEEATRRCNEYAARWPEALPGVLSPRGMTDEQIIAEIDETNRPDFLQRSAARTARRLRERKSDSPDKTR